MSKEPLFVAVSNQKGGVGKSALTVVLASYFHFEKNLNVAIIDCDSPQHSLVRMRERDKKAAANSAYYQQLLLQQWERVQKKAYPIVGSTAEKAREAADKLAARPDFRGSARNGGIHRGIPHHRQYGLCPDTYHAGSYHHAEYARFFHYGTRLCSEYEGCAAQGYPILLEQIEKTFQRGNFQVILGSHEGTAPDRS